MNKEFKDLQAMVEESLYAAFKEIQTTDYKNLWDAMAYATLNGGKRLRGVLCLALGERCGIPYDKMIPFAGALEMIHASTLIHDDMPCMDDDDFRRGKPSCHKQFGEDTALLAGDALYSFALESVCRRADRSFFSERKILDCLSVFLHNSGADGVLGGQVLDKKYEKELCSLEELMQLHTLKTGALFSAVAELVCVLAQPTEERQNALLQYMKSLGLAFQVKDDLLDVEGSFETLGKATHADESKSTFVSVLGVAASKKYLSECVLQARQSAAALPRPDFLLWICDFVMNRNS